MTNLLSNLSIPLRALASRSFYYTVMFSFKGIGLLYLFFLCAAVALPATVKVSQLLDSMKSLELGSLVTKIPASYISTTGVLEAKNPTGEPSFIYNSHDELIIVYNPYDSAADDTLEVKNAPITLTSYALVLSSMGETVSLPWATLYGTSGGEFEPLLAGQLVDATLSSSLYSIWIVVTLWFFFSLALVVIVAALFSKAIVAVFLKLQIPLLILARLCTYASTGVALIMCLQFYWNMAISFPVLCTVPIFYVVSFMVDLKKVLERTAQDPSYEQNPKNPLYTAFAKKDINLRVSTVVRQKNGKIVEEYVPNSTMNEEKPQTSETENLTQEQKEEIVSKKEEEISSVQPKDGDGAFRP